MYLRHKDVVHFHTINCYTWQWLLCGWVYKSKVKGTRASLCEIRRECPGNTSETMLNLPLISPCLMKVYINNHPLPKSAADSLTHLIWPFVLFCARAGQSGSRPLILKGKKLVLTMVYGWQRRGSHNSYKTNIV